MVFNVSNLGHFVENNPELLLHNSVIYQKKLEHHELTVLIKYNLYFNRYIDDEVLEIHEGIYL